MLPYILYFLAPDEKLPPGPIQYSLGYEGLSLGWAFFALVFLIAAVAWSYYAFAPALSRFSRISLIVLHSFLLGFLLLLLVHPILLITLDESTQRPLLVLVDMSQSMGLTDHRVSPEDMTRAALAKGLVDPAKGLKQSVSPEQMDDLNKLSRRQLLESLAANPRLNLWPRLHNKAELAFYGFGRQLTKLGDITPREGKKFTADDSAAFFQSLHYDDDLTALGDGLRDLLDQQRGQPLAGIFLITDGANNNGFSPIEAATMAQEDSVPLFIYGVGITLPHDVMIAQLDGPQVSTVKEKLQMTAHIRAQGVLGKKTTIQLKVDGKVVDEKPVEFRANGDQEVTLSYAPPEVGIVKMEASIAPLPEEEVKTNNTAVAKVRVVDDKVKVLLVEDQPYWDYRYLFNTIQGDHRLKLKCVLLHGDPELATETDSPFLSQLPSTKDELFNYDLIILGDVGPSEIGDARMKLLNEWVSKMGGGLIFLAGPKYNPNSYRGTPLEPMLPVEVSGETAERYDTPVQLKLTPEGESLPLLTASDNPQENLSIWAGFPGVDWTAWVGKARPGAHVLLTDPTPSRATPNGPMPVMALQSYGAGQTFYAGEVETYRWRSHLGEKYYVRIWGQILRALSTRPVSSLTQLETDRPQYYTGDRIHIAGHIFRPGFEPLVDPEVVGTVVIQPDAGPGQAAPAPQSVELRVHAIADRPGEYQGEMTASVAGSYSFSTKRDPTKVLNFQVVDPNVELSDIAMNEKLLRAMASASGGQFMREEDLNGLPDLVTAKSINTTTPRRISLASSPFLLGLMILIGCVAWFWRRKLELK